MSSLPIMNASLIFERICLDEKVPTPIQNAHFGLLHLQTNNATPVLNEEHDIIFMIDRSGSMSELCSDEKTKMSHILHTLKNMITYFKDRAYIKANITILSFDETVYKVVNRCVVTNDNYDDILSKINTIHPDLFTNIECALTSVSNIVTEIRQITENADTNIVCIFMTDGEATSGNINPTHLSTLVDPTITNEFIGFGIQHDAHLLRAISNGPKSTYYFIDKIENSGLVYGEILHKIVNQIMKNVSIRVNGGFLYDFKGNCWVTEYTMQEILNDTNKHFHIISNNPEQCSVTFSLAGGRFGPQWSMTVIPKGDEATEEEENLTPFVYRQRTLQLLAKVTDLLNKKNYDKKRGYDYMHKSTSFKGEEKLIKKELKALMEEMKSYMDYHGLNDDKFMKNLCDDIYVTYKTFTTKYGAMYSTARQSSQGSQRAYTVTQIPCDTDADTDVANTGHGLFRSVFCRAPTRMTNRSFTDDDDDDGDKDGEEDTDLIHTLSDFNDAPYLTPISTQLMREISCPNEER